MYFNCQLSSLSHFGTRPLLAPAARTSISPSSQDVSCPLSRPRFSVLTTSPLTLLNATLTQPPISVDSKPLTATLSSLDATLTKNRGWGQSASLLPFRNEDHLGRRISEGRPVEIPVQGRNAEPASREKVFDLVPEEIPQRPGEHQPLPTAVPMRDGKNHLHVISLLRAMERGYSLADAHLPAATSGLRRIL